MSDRARIVVIGGGVIGMSTALMAQARGFSVTVVERDTGSNGASSGNAGALAFPDILPLASSGIMRKAPKWLLDPLGPLSIPPRYALKIAPWMWRFWRASWPGRIEASIAAQGSLMTLSRDTLAPFLDQTGTAHMLRTDGQLLVYESEAEFQAALPSWDIRARHNIPFEHLKSPEAIAERQPGLAPQFCAATFTPSWCSIADPRDYLQALREKFIRNTGQFETAEVATVLPAADGVVVHLKDGRQLTANKALIAAGAWSHHLARGLADNIPLETERGYNTTLAPTAFDLKCQVTFGGHGFVVTRLTQGIRVGGMVELGGLSLPPNYKRADIMLKKAKQFLPDLNTQNGTQWMGFRPSMPDSLPVIGTSSASRNIVYAFGHGHLGLTQSTGTATLACELLTGSAPSISLSAFSPTRF